MSRDFASLMPNRQAAKGVSVPQLKLLEGKDFGSPTAETSAVGDRCGGDLCHLLAEALTVNVRLPTALILSSVAGHLRGEAVAHFTSA